MIVRRITETLPDGKMEVTLAISEDQHRFIMSVGLAALVSNGAVALQDVTREEFEQEIRQSNEQEQDGVPAPALEESANEDSIAGYRDGPELGVRVATVSTEPQPESGQAGN